MPVIAASTVFSAAPATASATDILRPSTTTGKIVTNDVLQSALGTGLDLKIDVLSASGVDSGVKATVTGTGAGKALFGLVSGNGNGEGAVGLVTGNGNGSGVFGQVTGAGSGHGTVGQVSGSGSGNGINGAVNGTGAGHGVYGYVASAASFAGYFDGKVYSSVSFTTSDLRLKSDIKDVTDAKAFGGLAIKSFVKHTNGITKDKNMAGVISQLEAEIAAYDAKGGAANEDIEEKRKRVSDWHAEDFLPLMGDPIPGRQIGVIAQDVQAIGPEYVNELPDGTLSVNDTSVLYAMVSDLRATVAAISAEFASYRATHP